MLTMPSGFLTVLISFLFLACVAALGAAAERAPERVRIAVSSKSLGFLASTIARGSISGAPVRLVSLSLRTSFHILVARPQFKTIADLRVKTVLDQQGKPDLPLNRVIDPTITEEVLRERR